MDGAREEATLIDLIEALDSGFLLLCAFLVFFMQYGFAMLENGTSRLQNTASVLLKSFCDVFTASLSFYCFGNGIAFGQLEGINNTFMGIRGFLPLRYDLAFLFFQTALASTTATIVSGSLIERCRHAAHIAWTSSLIIFIYPFVVHWVWSNTGFMSIHNPSPIFGRPLIDFAGGGVVHLCAGTAAFMSARRIGPRIGFFGSEGDVQEIQGHSINLTGFGVLAIWYGFYGVTCGSTKGLTGGRHKLSALAAINTTVSGASAGIFSVILNLAQHKPTFENVINSTLTGLVAVTSGCQAMRPWAAGIIGITSVFVYALFKRFVLLSKVDDPMCATSIHGGGGLWALISAGMFVDGKELNGLFYGDTYQFVFQLCGAVIIIAWVSTLSFLWLYIIDRTICLRANFEHERVGLDRQLGVDENVELFAIHKLMEEMNGLENLISSGSDAYPLKLKFREFLSREGSAQKLDFLLDVAQFHRISKKLIESNHSINASPFDTFCAKIIARAYEILRQYVANTAPEQVSISVNIRDDLEANINLGNVIAIDNSLQRAFHEVLDELKESTWKRFLSERRDGIEQNGRRILTTRQTMNFVEIE